MNDGTMRGHFIEEIGVTISDFCTYHTEMGTSTGAGDEQAHFWRVTATGSRGHVSLESIQQQVCGTCDGSMAVRLKILRRLTKPIVERLP
jgi:hypothetical protein